MVDDPEVPITNGGQNQENVQYDDHGQRQENGGGGNEEINRIMQARLDERAYRIQPFAKDNPDTKQWSEEFLETWGRYFHNHFLIKDSGILNAVFSVEAFDEYVGVIKKRIVEKRKLTKQQIDSNKAIKEKLYKEVSETIEKEIVLKISELYIDVDKKHPDETFEDIVQANFMESIRLSYDVIGKKLTQLQRSLSTLAKSDELPEELKELVFYKKISQEESKEVERKSGGGMVSDFSSRPIPVPVRVETPIGDFVQYISTQTEHYMNLRRYLHNSMVIFKRGKGEHGFYAGLADYAKQLSTSDIDSIMLLPDSQLFMAAHNLYVKQLTIEFAKYSWIHQPGMFSADFFNINTDIEEKVLEDLRRLYPDITKEEDWRLTRALKMGIGISRGVTLSEVEIAAYADPAVRTGKGPKDVTFESFYIGDSSALTAFRPTYNMERFMPPDLSRGPLFFMPVSGFKRDKYWDHNDLWKRMSEFQQSYTEGKGFANRGKDELLLIDAMQNFGKVGSIDYRSGWRYIRGYEAWLKEIGKTGKIDFLESWKQIENIGYVVLKNFSDFYLLHENDGKDFIKGGENGERTAERDRFFTYLNDKYINFNPLTRKTDKSFGQEIAEIRDQHKDFSDAYVYKFLLNKALFGVLRNRLPTLFIRLDRNRMTDDGVRAYEKIRRGIDPSGTWDEVRMDTALRNLSDIEMRLRLDTSKQMSEYMSEHSNDLKDPNIQYIMDENFIRKNLGEMVKGEKNPEQQIQDAVDLLKHINSNYLTDSEFANDKIKMLYDGKYPYTLALEEFDRSFVAYRAAGETPLYRALNDTAQIEQKVSEAVTKYVGLLKDVSLDTDHHDMSPLIKTLSEMRQQISILHGEPEAWKKMSYLVGATINYFRKDSVGKAFYGALGVGRRNSIASEFAGGTSRGVWEWDNPEIDRFIFECERQRIIPRDEKELKEPPEIIPVTNKFLNFLGIKERHKHKVDKKIMTGNKARELFGATKGEIIKGYLWKYLPLIFAVLIWASMAKAFKKEVTGKDQ